MSQYGVENSKQVLDLIFSLGGAVKTSLADGKFDLMDIANFISIFPKLEPALKDISHVPHELKDLDADEAKELQEYLLKKFGEVLGKEGLVDKINSGLHLALAIHEFVNALKK
jgi:hypothetical protein